MQLITASPSGKALKDCPGARPKFERAALLVLSKLACHGAVDSEIQNGGLCTERAYNALCMALGFATIVPSFPLRHKELCVRYEDSYFDQMIKDKRFPAWAVESAREFCKAAMSTASELQFNK